MEHDLSYLNGDLEDAVQLLASTMLKSREKRALEFSDIGKWMHANIDKPMMTKVGNPATDTFGASAAKHIGWSALGAGAGSLMGLGSSMMAPEKKRKPLSSMLMGGLLGGTAGLGGSLIHSNFATATGGGPPGAAPPGAAPPGAAPPAGNDNGDIIPPEIGVGGGWRIHPWEDMRRGAIGAGAVASGDIAGLVARRYANRPFATRQELMASVGELPADQAAYVRQVEMQHGNKGLDALLRGETPDLHVERDRLGSVRDAWRHTAADEHATAAHTKALAEHKYNQELASVRHGNAPTYSANQLEQNLRAQQKMMMAKLPTTHPEYARIAALPADQQAMALAALKDPSLTSGGMTAQQLHALQSEVTRMRSIGMSPESIDAHIGTLSTQGLPVPRDVHANPITPGELQQAMLRTPYSSGANGKGVPHGLNEVELARAFEHAQNDPLATEFPIGNKTIDLNRLRAHAAEVEKQLAKGSEIPGTVIGQHGENPNPKPGPVREPSRLPNAVAQGPMHAPERVQFRQSLMKPGLLDSMLGADAATAIRKLSPQQFDEMMAAYEAGGTAPIRIPGLNVPLNRAGLGQVITRGVKAQGQGSGWLTRFMGGRYGGGGLPTFIGRTPRAVMYGGATLAPIFGTEYMLNRGDLTPQQYGNVRAGQPAGRKP